MKFATRTAAACLAAAALAGCSHSASTAAVVGDVAIRGQHAHPMCNDERRNGP